ACSSRTSRARTRSIEPCTHRAARACPPPPAAAIRATHILARRLLPLLTLAVTTACGRGVDSTGAPAPTATLARGPGVHDHTPHHGGVVGMAGDPHPEARAAPDGRVRVYLTDLRRRPLPAASTTG